MNPPSFSPRGSKQQIEEGLELAPKFDENGLIPVVTTDHATGEVLMMAYMNAEALRETIEKGEAVYWSRSRNKRWKKGEESGNVQVVREMRTDCDQDAIWLRVTVMGLQATCHTGFRSCFYRSIPTGPSAVNGVTLCLEEKEKVFDPKEVYGR
ncbi:MAG: phosphoribosyl-AMP cyclohydrolase [Candidatus Methylacidiphilales bacterium]|nr:phosphoribosyl-AMP cyclohydrolase [Candidatus Methylacidiphilales bacterium]